MVLLLAIMVIILRGATLLISVAMNVEKKYNLTIRLQKKNYFQIESYTVVGVKDRAKLIFFIDDIKRNLN